MAVETVPDVLDGSPPHTWGQHKNCRCRPAQSAVHPHTRGDNGHHRAEVVFVFRFTPTHVGTTPRMPATRSGLAVHPHTRGDNGHMGRFLNDFGRFTPTHVGTTKSSWYGCQSLTGSPPHTWGQRFAQSFASFVARFTPTHVGTTVSPPSEQSAGAGSPPHTWGQLGGCAHGSTGTSVHPHTRGDNGVCVCFGIACRGSPPHTWGQLCSRYAARRPTAVHPHTRGDNGGANHISTHTTGSPPHTWGQRQRGFAASPGVPVHPHTRGDNTSTPSPNRSFHRFTPTHVGTTEPDGQGSHRRHGSPPHTWGQRSYPPLSNSRDAVHPHTRGDNLKERHPPRERLRFTPTHVGTTCHHRSTSVLDAGSPPHTWGQLRTWETQAVLSDGSPPHTWGQREIPSQFSCSVPVHPHTRGDNSNPLCHPDSMATRDSPSITTILRVNSP